MWRPLSRALVGFDNAFECGMPHRTTRYGATGDADRVPWLASTAMWVHGMRFVPEDGITTKELARRARLTATSAPMILKRMGRWWGYLRVERDGADGSSRVVFPLPPAGRRRRCGSR